MSTWKIQSKFHEEQFDQNGEFLREYHRNIPHFTEIKNRLEQSFKQIFDNQDNNPLSRYFDEPLSNIVESCKMECKECTKGPDSGIALMIVSIALKPGYNISQKRDEILYDWFDAQMSDGWGEVVFGIELFKDNDISIRVEVGE